MALLIVRTNPDPRKDGRFTCSQCHGVEDTFDAAKTCAEADYRRRTGRDPVPLDLSTLKEEAA